MEASPSQRYEPRKQKFHSPGVESSLSEELVGAQLVGGQPPPLSGRAKLTGSIVPGLSHSQLKHNELRQFDGVDHFRPLISSLWRMPFAVRDQEVGFSNVETASLPVGVLDVAPGEVGRARVGVAGQNRL